MTARFQSYVIIYGVKLILIDISDNYGYFIFELCSEHNLYVYIDQYEHMKKDAYSNINIPDIQQRDMNISGSFKGLNGITAVRGIIGIIIVLMYLFLTLTSVKLIFGSFDLGIISLIPWMTILVDGGDRIVRYFMEFKKQIKRVKYLKKEDKSVKTFRSLSKYPKRYSDTLTDFKLEPYAILVSVYKIQGKWDQFKEQMDPWKDKLYIIDDASPDRTRELVLSSGFNLIKNPFSNHKPKSILYGLSILPSQIKTVMVIDHDVELPDRTTLERAIFDFQRSDAAACGVQVLPSFNQEKNALWKCQMLEYEDSMSLGRIIPHNHIFTSGASALFKKEVLGEMLKRTSLSMYAEDMEISIQLISNNLRTYFDRRVVTRTKIPSTLKRLTCQRMSWAYGQLKVTASYFTKSFIKKDPFFIYNFYIYNFFIMLLLHPLRVISITAYIISLGVILMSYFNPFYMQYQIFSMYTLLFMTIFFILWSAESLFWSSNLNLKPNDSKIGNIMNYLSVITAFTIYRFYLTLVPNTLGYLNYISFKLFKRMIVKDAYGFNKHLIKI